MKKLAFGSLLVGLLVACGGGDKTIKVIDGNTVDDVGVCNPLTQAGCEAGQKCSWIVDALMPQYVGHVGCVPDGTAAAGDACMFGAPGEAGFDNCSKGTVCGNYRGGAGVCKKVCDQQGGEPMCASTHVCVTYSGLFSTGDTTPAAGGVCDLACNPLEDNDFDGSSGSDVKGSNVCGTAASVGCYGSPSYGTPPATGWSCTNDINVDQSQPTGLRHRVECTEANNCADPGPVRYLNSCNQGYLPLMYDTTGSTKVVCIAICKPLPCYGPTANGPNCRTGGISAVGAMGNRDGAVPHECRTVNRVGSFTPTEHCQFMWWRETDDSGNLLTSATSDTTGICMDFGKYKWDSNGDNKADNADNYLPNCDTLVGSAFGSGSDRSMPETYFGPADLGCVPTTYLPAAANGKRTIPEESLRKRMLTNLPRALYRRTMDN